MILSQGDQESFNFIGVVANLEHAADLRGLRYRIKNNLQSIWLIPSLTIPLSVTLHVLTEQPKITEGSAELSVLRRNKLYYPCWLIVCRTATKS